MNKIEVRSNPVPSSAYPPCYIFCHLGRDRGIYRGSRGGKW